MSNTDNLAESGNTVSNTSVSKHLGNGGRLSNLVRNLDYLSTVRMGGSTNTESVVR